ncbi:MAG: transcription antitermination factor NusB [Phycisphaerales bacterium]
MRPPLARTAPTPPTGSVSPARAAALDRRERLASRFPDLEFGEHGPPGLDARYAALARAIEHAAAQRWLTLAALARACIDRRWENVDHRIKAAVLGAAAQLFLFGNQADHAVVDDTVEWTKARGHRGAPGFVNAVLRRMVSLRGGIEDGDAADPARGRGRDDVLPLADGRVLRLTRGVFGRDEVQRTCEQLSVGEELFLHWINAVGRERAFARALHCLRPAPLVVAGLPEAAFVAGGTLEGRAVPHARPGYHVWTDGHESLVAALAAHPGARVQDAASARPVHLSDALRPAVILDACAGRGTKTGQLAELHPQAEVVATDVDGVRLRALAKAFEGHPRVKVTTPEGLRRVVGRVDLLVLDVPCSNTGVLPRRPEAKYRFTRARLDSLVRLQRQIVEEHRLMLSPEGAILYATCSLEPTENEQQVAWAAGRTGRTVARQERAEPEGLPGGPDTAYSDGGFGALLAAR